MGVSHFIIQYFIVFSVMYHPAIGDPPFMKSPKYKQELLATHSLGLKFHHQLSGEIKKPN